MAVTTKGIFPKVIMAFSKSIVFFSSVVKRCSVEVPQTSVVMTRSRVPTSLPEETVARGGLEVMAGAMEERQSLET